MRMKTKKRGHPRKIWYDQLKGAIEVIESLIGT